MSNAHAPLSPPASPSPVRPSDGTSASAPTLTPPGPRSTWDRVRAASRSLSARLLALTVVVVLIVEVLIFLPSAANFQTGWMMERVERAQTASLAVEASPTFMVSEDLAGELLANAEVHAVALKRDGRRVLILSGAMTPEPPVAIDLRNRSMWRALYETCETFFAAPGRYLRLIDTPRLEGGEFIEVIVPEAALKAELKSYSGRIFVLSLIVSGVTGAVVYAVLGFAFVRPIRRLAAAMVRFRADPEDRARVITPSRRSDEIGLAERELEGLQNQVRTALQQRARLAALGEAVAKINHDLRNILAAAQLISDRLAANPDPKVRAQAARMVLATDRGVRLAEDVLAYGKAQEPAARPAVTALRAALEDAFADAVAASNTPTGLDLDVDDDLAAYADPEHLHRILLNLMRNAVQAMAADDARDAPGVLTLRATAVLGPERGGEPGAELVEITIADDGPGIPASAQASLFTPFSSVSRPGGTGLGLSIARELARANQGDVRLISSKETGAVFGVRLPRAHADPQAEGALSRPSSPPEGDAI